MQLFNCFSFVAVTKLSSAVSRLYLFQHREKINNTRNAHQVADLKHFRKRFVHFKVFQSHCKSVEKDTRGNKGLKSRSVHEMSDLFLSFFPAARIRRDFDSNLRWFFEFRLMFGLFRMGRNVRIAILDLLQVLLVQRFRFHFSIERIRRCTFFKLGKGLRLEREKTFGYSISKTAKVATNLDFIRAIKVLSSIHLHSVQLLLAVLRTSTS